MFPYNSCHYPYALFTGESILVCAYISYLSEWDQKKPSKKPASKSNVARNQASSRIGYARKRPSASFSTAAKKKPVSITDSSPSCSLEYPTWREAKDDNVQPCAFAFAVAKHYAEAGIRMTAMNVQSLMEEAEDASSYLQISASSCICARCLQTALRFVTDSF